MANIIECCKVALSPYIINDKIVADKMDLLNLLEKADIYKIYILYSIVSRNIYIVSRLNLIDPDKKNIYKKFVDDYYRSSNFFSCSDDWDILRKQLETRIKKYILLKNINKLLKDDNVNNNTNTNTDTNYKCDYEHIFKRTDFPTNQRQIDELMSDIKREHKIDTAGLNLYYCIDIGTKKFLKLKRLIYFDNYKCKRNQICLNNCYDQNSPIISDLNLRLSRAEQIFNIVHNDKILTKNIRNKLADSGYVYKNNIRIGNNNIRILNRFISEAYYNILDKKIYLSDNVNDNSDSSNESSNNNKQVTTCKTKKIGMLFYLKGVSANKRKTNIFCKKKSNNNTYAAQINMLFDKLLSHPLNNNFINRKMYDSFVEYVYNNSSKI
jgi:hypothetical protein